MAAVGASFEWDKSGEMEEVTLIRVILEIMACLSFSSCDYNLTNKLTCDNIRAPLASANELTNILSISSVPIPSLFNLFLKAVVTDRNVTQLVATRIQRSAISTVTKTKSSLSSFSSTVWMVPKRGCVRLVVVSLSING